MPVKLVCIQTKWASHRAFEAQHRARAACSAASIFSFPADSSMNMQFVSDINRFPCSSATACTVIHSLIGRLLDCLVMSD